MEKRRFEKEYQMYLSKGGKMVYVRWLEVQLTENIRRFNNFVAQLYPKGKK